MGSNHSRDNWEDKLIVNPHWTKVRKIWYQHARLLPVTPLIRKERKIRGGPGENWRDGWLKDERQTRKRAVRPLGSIITGPRRVAVQTKRRNGKQEDGDKAQKGTLIDRMPCESFCLLPRSAKPRFGSLGGLFYAGQYT